METKWVKLSDWLAPFEEQRRRNLSQDNKNESQTSQQSDEIVSFQYVIFRGVYRIHFRVCHDVHAPMSKFAKNLDSFPDSADKLLNKISSGQSWECQEDTKVQSHSHSRFHQVVAQQ